MQHSMIHWQGNQLAVIDTETSGLDPYYHEIMQIAIVPLDSNLKPRKDVLPFCIDLKLDFPERLNIDAIKINKIDLNNLMLRGFDHEKAKDLLREWIDKLELPITASGIPCKIKPLGQNFAFDRSFMIRWLGIDMYNELFDYHFVDTMVIAQYLNDRAVVHGEKPPYARVNLGSLANKLKITHETKHNALSDCLCCAEVYRQMCLTGLLA